MEILKKIILVFFVFLFTLSLVPSFSSNQYSFAAEDQSVENGVYPGSSTYIFKRIKEKVITFLTFSKTKKVDYLGKLLDTRLDELTYLAETQKKDRIEKASSRYAYYAGLLAENAFELDNKKKLQIKVKFGKHKKVLPDLRDKFPANSTYWLAIQQDIDTLQLLSNDL